ncbi:MAG: hypothetical protein WCF31_06170 [Candidatus Deferrimicrobiaceae bacterium]
MEPSWRRTISRAAVLLCVVLIAGCATAPKAPADKALDAPVPRSVEDRSGVEVVSLRPTGAGGMLDFRYRVVDPVKATPLLLRKTPAYLIDPGTGVIMTIPETSWGKMRQDTLKPEKGRVYFMLFHNAGLSAGDKVTVVIGKYRFENLTVQ